MGVERSGELDGSNSTVCTKEELDALCNKILSEIITEGMTDKEKAEAIYNRVNSIKYVSTDDDPSWIGAAYTGLTTGRGDCWNYASASKALLTLAGIPNYDIRRHGGTSDHFWQIVYVDDGWYHFDACPTLKKYYIRCFLLTEDEVIEYSNNLTTIPNYFIYDYDSCPYEVVKSRK
jgi:transglutaminase-like putative cysteine protease